MSKNKVEVVIGGNIYGLQGEESEVHIQRVASLIDKQIVALREAYGKKNLNAAKLYMLVALNMANDYVKIEEVLEMYTRELEKCSGENLALEDRIQELTLEITQIKTQMESKNIYNKRNDHTNRGR